MNTREQPAAQILLTKVADPQMFGVAELVDPQVAGVEDPQELDLLEVRLEQLAVLMLVAGNWHTVTKIRDRLAQLQRDLQDDVFLVQAARAGRAQDRGIPVTPIRHVVFRGRVQGVGYRAADVTLKEKRPLVLCVRETPLNKIHIRNMYRAADAGATIFPLIPAFYYGPTSLDEVAREFAYRVLAHVGLPQPNAFRWKG